MKSSLLLAVLACFANVHACFGTMVFTVSPTDRVDTETQVTLTYSVTGAADIGTQDLAAFFVRVNFPNTSYPPNSLATTPFSINRAPDNTPFGLNATFSAVSLTPGPTAVRWQANINLNFSGPNQTLDTIGAPVGSFKLTWNRPLTGEYDAAMLLGNMSSSYNVAPFTPSDNLLGAQSSIGVGVSTLIAPIPEPGSMTLIGLGGLWATGRRLRRRAICA